MIKIDEAIGLGMRRYKSHPASCGHAVKKDDIFLAVIGRGRSYSTFCRKCGIEELSRGVNYFQELKDRLNRIE